MSGQIFAFFTATRVKWGADREGNPFEDPTVENGWVDWSWNSRELCEARNYVRPYIDMAEDDDDLQGEITYALSLLDGGYESNGGSFYATEGYQPYDEEWTYSYALHFVRKFFGPNGWTEEDWNPAEHGFKI